MTDKKKPSGNIWKYTTMLLAGLLLGYVIGRFELTTLNFIVSPNEQKDEKTQDQDKNTQEKEEDTAPQGPVDVNTDGDLILGNNNAKITIIDFSDYQCPFSERFYSEIFVNLKQDFIDKGVVKYIFKDYPLNFHPNALPAAIAAECAGQQNKYWEMHSKLFETQEVWSGLENTEDTYNGYAKEIGLNLTKYTACIGEQSIKDEIMTDRSDGTAAGASGTPTLFINGMIVRGVPQSYDQFKQYLESQIGN